MGIIYWNSSLFTKICRITEFWDLVNTPELCTNWSDIITKRIVNIILNHFYALIKTIKRNINDKLTERELYFGHIIIGFYFSCLR